jgi:hypothetical protein
MLKATVRIIEIEILGVSHRRWSKVVNEPRLPAPAGRAGQSRLWDRGEEDRTPGAVLVGMPREADRSSPGRR